MANQVDGARVLVVSGSFGAGHDRAADQLSLRLARSGFGVDRADFAQLLPAGAGRLLRAAYRAQLRRFPATWGWLFSAAGSAAGGAPTEGVCAPAGSRLLRLVTPDTIAVVSTYPLASQALGLLRRSGRLSVPAITFLTDMSVHRLWFADGVDAYLAIHPLPASEARGFGAPLVRVCGPLVSPLMSPAADAAQRNAERARFGLPPVGRLALVVTGSWGVGEVLASARDIAATGVATAVVACGANHAARRHITRSGLGVGLGWVDDMVGLYRACDVVVQSGGGMSSLEALACGLPVVTYRPLPGHGHTNAAALQQAGWAPWARNPAELADALVTAAWPTSFARPVADVPEMIADVAGVPVAHPRPPAAVTA